MGEEEQEVGEKEQEVGELEMGKAPTPQQQREGAFLQSFLLDTGTDRSQTGRRKSARRSRSRRSSEQRKPG